MIDLLLPGVHLIALLGVLSSVAAAGRMVAGQLRLPLVIGEILVSLAFGPALSAVVGRQTFGILLPADITGLLTRIGDVGLVLFLVGVVYHLEHGSGGLRNRAVGRVTVGVFVLPLLSGLVFAGWLFRFGPAELRGSAPLPALLVLLLVAMSVTAVPVLARIIEDREGDLGRSGRLAMMSAMLIDTVAWLMLAVALGLAAGGLGGVTRAVTAIAVGAALTFAGRRALAAPALGAAGARYPRGAAALLAALVLTAAAGARWAGLTAIFGAFLIGMMIPRDAGRGPWNLAVATISGIGRRLVPVFFVVTGMTLFLDSPAALPWAATALCTGLAIVGKVGGGYLGARWAGEDLWSGLRVGALVNTRGLTEIVVLQAGYAAGLLTSGLFAALLVMALITTGLTGPLLSLIDHHEARRESLVRQGGMP